MGMAAAQAQAQAQQYFGWLTLTFLFFDQIDSNLDGGSHSWPDLTFWSNFDILAILTPFVGSKNPKMGSKWAIFDFSRFSSQIGVVGHTLDPNRQFGQILPFWPFWPRFGGVKIFDFLGSKIFFSKKFSKFFSIFFSFKNQLRILKMTCCKTPSEHTLGLQPALVIQVDAVKDS